MKMKNMHLDVLQLLVLITYPGIILCSMAAVRKLARPIIKRNACTFLKVLQAILLMTYDG